jgi:hypothetical protein
MRKFESGEHEERSAEAPTLADGKEMMAQGKSLWSRVDFESTRKKRTKAIEALERYQQKTGISTEKHIHELEKYGEKSGLVNGKLNKIEKGATNWYKKLLTQSGAFKAEGKLGKLLAEEKNDLVKYFSKLDLAEGDEHSNKVDVLCNIEDTIKPKRAFIERYRKQTPYVKHLFDKLMPTLSLVGSKEALLDKVLSSVGDMEDQPQAVQHAFKERTKNIKDPDKLNGVKTEVQAEFKKMESQYTSKLFKNMQYFGGKMEKTEIGDMTTTAKEFRKWFMERPSLANMKDGLKKLPKYIKERQRLHEKRDQILQDAKPADRKHFEKVTKLMRRHELEKYLKDTLEPAVQKDNLITAEYAGEVITAREGGADLFSAVERAQKNSRFRAANVEDQKAMLRVERMEIQARKTVVQEYMGLPENFRRDASFAQANAIARMQMLEDAKKRHEKSQNASPFEIDMDETLSDEDTRTLTAGLETGAGEALLSEALKDQEGEKIRRTIELQNMTWRRLKTNLKIADWKNQTQEERFDEDLARWTYKDKNVKKIEDTTSRRMKNKVEFHDAAKHLYNKGIVTYSSGQMRERQDVTDQDLLKGNESIAAAHTRAKYATDFHVSHADGRENKDPIKIFERVAEETMRKFIPQMLEDMAANMGMSRMQSLALINSKDAANNTLHFLQKRSVVDDELDIAA